MAAIVRSRMGAAEGRPSMKDNQLYQFGQSVNVSARGVSWRFPSRLTSTRKPVDVVGFSSYGIGAAAGAWSASTAQSAELAGQRRDRQSGNATQTPPGLRPAVSPTS